MTSGFDDDFDNGFDNGFDDQPGRSPHPDAGELALFADDALPEDDARTTRNHVRGCAACEEQVEALSALTRQLAAVPAPPMPAEVVARIDAALVRAATERIESGRVESGRVESGRAEAARRAPARRHRGAAVLRWTFGVAGVAAAAAVAGALVLGGGPMSSNDDGSQSGAQIAGAPELDRSGNSVTPNPTAMSTADTADAADTEDLDAQVLALVARTQASETTPATKSSGVDSVDPPTDDSYRFHACIGIVGDVRERADDPVAAEVTTYAGEPAVLLVYSAEHSNALEAYVVSVDCLLPGTASSAGVVLRKAIIDR
jgi:hypothetical protein